MDPIVRKAAEQVLQSEFMDARSVLDELEASERAGSIGAAPASELFVDIAPFVVASIKVLFSVFQPLEVSKVIVLSVASAEIHAVLQKYWRARKPQFSDAELERLTDLISQKLSAKENPGQIEGGQG